MKKKYVFGKDFKDDEKKASSNISKILKGKFKRKGNISKKFVAWKTP